MLGDREIRDWNLALGQFRDLPPSSARRRTLAATPSARRSTGFSGRIRVLVGALVRATCRTGGGIGQAAVQSAADALLLGRGLAVHGRRSGSHWPP